MAKIIALLHYKNPLIQGKDYATVSEREYPKSDLYKFYSEDNLPKKYRKVIERSCDKDTNNIEKWYLK